MRRSVKWVSKRWTRSRASTFEKVSCCANWDTKPRSSRQCRIRKLGSDNDPTSKDQPDQPVWQAHRDSRGAVHRQRDRCARAFTKGSSNSPTVHREQWRCIRCSLSTQSTTFSWTSRGNCRAQAQHKQHKFPWFRTCRRQSKSCKFSSSTKW